MKWGMTMTEWKIWTFYLIKLKSAVDGAVPDHCLSDGTTTEDATSAAWTFVASEQHKCDGQSCLLSTWIHLWHQQMQKIPKKSAKAMQKNHFHYLEIFINHQDFHLYFIRWCIGIVLVSVLFYILTPNTCPHFFWNSQVLLMAQLGTHS